MTKTMEQAIEKLRRMPEHKQDSFARFLLHELDTDAMWEASTNKHEGNVANLVGDVLSADERGETELLDPDRL